MAAENLIGVDIGTQGTKSALFDASGRCLAQAFRKSRLHQPAPGVTEEDPERQVQSVCETVRECLRTSKAGARSVAAVAIDGQMAGVLGIGADGRHVTCYDSWLDTRCAPYIARMSKVAGAEILAKTGCAPSFNHGPRILWWMHERPRVFRRIAAFIQPGAYAAMCLCGLAASDAFIDTTYLQFSGFADNARGRWDSALCRRFELNAALLPRIVAPHSLVGEIIPAMARRCGVAAGTPVAAGCGDTAASFLACGAVNEGVCVDVAGTASVFATTTRAFRADRDHRVLVCGRSAVPGLWHPYAYINGGGLNLKWFVERIAGGDADLDRLNRQAAARAPSASAPLFIPHLGGRVCPSQPGLRGAWLQLNWTHGQADLYRAVLEGVALEYALYLGIVRKLYPRFRPAGIRVTGGGERSAVWNQIKADVLRKPVRQVSRREGAPLGAALLAGLAVGLFKDLRQTARQWVTTSRAWRPDRKVSAICAERERLYRNGLGLLDHLQDERALKMVIEP